MQPRVAAVAGPDGAAGHQGFEQGWVIGAGDGIENVSRVEQIVDEPGRRLAGVPGPQAL